MGSVAPLDHVIVDTQPTGLQDIFPGIRLRDLSRDGWHHAPDASRGFAGSAQGRASRLVLGVSFS